MDRIAPINGLRGLAILSLLFSNITHDLFLSGPFLPKGNLSPGALISSTWSGVDLLFILSGFVLFAPYAGGRRALTSGDALWQFYRHRLLRLMPLYYLALAIDLFVKPKPWPEALWLASGVFDIHPASTQHLSNWPLWLLGITIIYSLIFPGLVWLWSRLGPWRLVPIVVIVAFLTRIIAYSVIGDHFIFAIRGTEWGAPYAALAVIGHLDEFVLGMMIAHMWRAGRIYPSTAVLVWPGLVATAAAWVVMAYLGLVQGYWQALAAGVAGTVFAVGYALLVIAALSQAGLFARLLSLRPLQIIGMMSYSLFVWHEPVLRLIRPSRSGNVLFLEGSLLCLIVIFIVAAISYRFVEFPRVKDWRTLFLLPQPTPPHLDRPLISAQIEDRFLFVLRMIAGWLFLYASLSEVHNPAFMTTHVLPTLSHAGLFQPFFAVFASPAILPTVTLLVAYGHLLIGLSLLSGLMVRVSASFAIALLMLYWLAGFNLPDLAGHPLFHTIKFAGEALLGDIHILYCVVLAYLIAGHAGHAWGLDGWVSRLPLLARRRGLRALVA